jgi:hypothetical protein
LSAAPEERLRELLDRLDEARQRLEQAATDPDAALAALGEVSELARQATAEVERAREAARAEGSLD